MTLLENLAINGSKCELIFKVKFKNNVQIKT